MWAKMLNVSHRRWPLFLSALVSLHHCLTVTDRPQLCGQLFSRQGVYNSWKSPGIWNHSWKSGISWNFIDAPEKFNCQVKYDNTPVTEPNLVTSLNQRNCHLTIFCAVLFIVQCHILLKVHVFISHVVILRRLSQCKNPAGTLLHVSWKSVNFLDFS